MAKLRTCRTCQANYFAPKNPGDLDCDECRAKNPVGTIDEEPHVTVIKLKFGKGIQCVTNLNDKGCDLNIVVTPMPEALTDQLNSLLGEELGAIAANHIFKLGVLHTIQESM